MHRNDDRHQWLVKKSIICTKMAHNSEMCWHRGGAETCRVGAASRLAAGAPRRVSTEADSLTEWVLWRQAKKRWVTLKVNKIKAGNLRASLFHSPCRWQRGGWGWGGGDPGGWEDYTVWVNVCRHMCVYMDGGDGILTHFTSKTLWQHDGGLLTNTVNKQLHLSVYLIFTI